MLRSLLIYLIPASVGLFLLFQIIQANSATYDEVAYTRIACHWWLTGDCEEITRMGSPVTFWKLQTLPALIILEYLVPKSHYLQAPLTYLPDLLPWFRFSALSFWLIGLLLTQRWSQKLNGNTAAFWSGLLYALGPNILAHGSLLTMESPLWVFWTLAFACFFRYLRRSASQDLIFTGVFAGLAFSMKFTAILIPPIILLCRLFVNLKDSSKIFLSLFQSIKTVVTVVFLMILTNLIVTGLDVIPLSQQQGSHPWLDSNFDPRLASVLAVPLEMSWPVDWVGFLTQIKHQQSGGPGYLFGEVSDKGWFWYYPSTIILKIPVFILLCLVLRFLHVLILVKFDGQNLKYSDILIPLICLAFLVIACLGSKRNYGFRYLLPLAPMTIVWTSGLLERLRTKSTAYALVFLSIPLMIQIQPYPLSFFNLLSGGPEKGRFYLADSNLDWGQGLIQFKRIQDSNPEFQDMVFYYFGDLAPKSYGIKGKCLTVDASDNHPDLMPHFSSYGKRYTAISTSLINGPWGPPNYFSKFTDVRPVRKTSDWTIQIFENIESLDKKIVEDMETKPE